MPHSPPAAVAALSTLIILQIAMLAALYAGVAPHPPASTPVFGIAPFLGMSLATAAAAIILDTTQNLSGRVLCVLAAVMALVSFGPQKYFDPQIGLIWPAVLTGQLACAVLLVGSVRKP